LKIPGTLWEQSVDPGLAGVQGFSMDVLLVFDTASR
jgi:hypothetical protein